MMNRIDGLNKEAITAFRNSNSKRYERWRRGDLLSIALLTMPRQVKPENVVANLIGLKSEFEKRLS